MMSNLRACLFFLVSTTLPRHALGTLHLGAAYFDQERFPGLGLLQVRGSRARPRIGIVAGCGIVAGVKNSSLQACSDSDLDWRYYRLGDIVDGKGINSSSSEVQFGFPQTHSERLELYARRWPHSMATEYLNLTEEISNYDKLCEIVRERGNQANSVLPGSQAAVVHLRLGDTADKDNCESLWENGSKWKQWDGRPYVKPRGYYENIISKLPASIKEVVLVGSDVHQKKSELGPIAAARKHCGKVYIRKLEELFSLHGYRVTRRWNLLPDDDFVYLSHSTILVYGGGSYSRTAGNCVHRFGGSTLPATW